MRTWIYGTIRPISLLAWIPPLVGAILSGEVMGWGVFAACVGATVSVGFANTFNSLLDRFIDRHNPAKVTSVVPRVPLYYVTLGMLIPQALVLRHMPYHHALLSVLFVGTFWYTYLFGRLPVFKRAYVSATIAATAFLAAGQITSSLLVWSAALFVFFFWREGMKDRHDSREDSMIRFKLPSVSQIDWWVVTAPFLGACLIFACAYIVAGRIAANHLLLALGVSVAIWSTIQVRQRLRRYRMQFQHKSLAGRLGLVVAHVALAPGFMHPGVVLVVSVNTFTLLYQSFKSRESFERPAGSLLAAYLWSTLPLLPMLVEQRYDPLAAALAGLLFTFVFLWDRWRLFRAQSILT